MRTITPQEPPYPYCPVPESVNKNHDGGRQAQNGPLYYPSTGGKDRIAVRFACAACWRALKRARGEKYVHAIPPTRWPGAVNPIGPNRGI